MRIHELAKKLGLDSKELLIKLKDLNFSVKNHMSSVDNETAEIIIHEIEAIKKKEIEGNVIEVDFPITLKDLAVKLNKKSSELIAELMEQKKFFTLNQNIDKEMALTIAYSYKVTLKQKLSQEEEIQQVESKNLQKRAPIVTFMGHIDHGKTSILDYIRKSKIADKETGGITQHIGAYQVVSEKGEITFLDTPGHETFTAMRARGADITDIVVIVIAADDGVKPQTIEAIDHAKAAGGPIIVAINKIDKANANVDMVKQQLSKVDLVPEDWGGKTTTVGVSAITGQGIDELLDLIIIHAEMLELKADYERPATGVIVESRLCKGKGALASIIVKEGTLNIGDWCVCGNFLGKIKAMHDDLGGMVKSAGPSFPVEILGLNGIPNPGEPLWVVTNEKSAKVIVGKRIENSKNEKFAPAEHIKLEDLFANAKEEKTIQLKVVLKADVGGTLEAVESALKNINSQEVELVIVHKGVGEVNSSDILLAEVTDSIVVGFKVEINVQVRELSRRKGIETRSYQIVYELIDDVKAALEGLLAPQVKRTFVGRAIVKTIFKLSKSGIIAGCIVDKGKVVRGSICELSRNNEVIFKSKVITLKRFKEEVKEVIEGMECGVGIGYNKLEENDVIDIFHEEIITRRLK
ncbi:MAG: translation initiation factor IF-2 [Candidatus Omnitrophica bacterium]|nr:translation initiation factor IF-2 [Candidatus Omnitrophota bacterium]